MNLETERLLLSEITLNDAESIYAIYSHPKVIEYYTDAPIAGEDDTVNFISRITAGDNLIFSIRLKEKPDDIIGDCGLHDRNEETSTIEMGGSLLPDFWGKGIMTEAFNALIIYARNEMNVRMIMAKTNRHNRQAIRAIKKLGFTVSSMTEAEVILSKKCIN